MRPPAAASTTGPGRRSAAKGGTRRGPVLHLTLVFNIDHTNATAYASAASNILSGPAETGTVTRRPE